MKKLQVNLFCMQPHRFTLAWKNINELISLSRDDVRLVIYSTEDIIEMWKSRLVEIGYNSLMPIEFEVMSNHSYTPKVTLAHQTDCEYSCKLDDDVLISKHTWRYILDNLDKITDQSPIIAPILTNGMSSVELFMEDFLNDEQRKEAEEIILSGTVQTNIWGLDFSGVNAKLRSMTTWNGREYWEFIEKYDNGHKTRGKNPFYYVVLGVHPSRFSYEFNMFIAKHVIENQQRFFGPQDYRLEHYITPYFTNNMFLCKSDFWRDTFKIVNDGWDEGQLTIQMRRDGTSPLYVRNGFGIHMAYGCTDRQREIEDYYIGNL